MCIPLQTKHPTERIKSVKVFLKMETKHMEHLRAVFTSHMLHMFIKCVAVCAHKYVPYVTVLQNVFCGECHNLPN